MIQMYKHAVFSFVVLFALSNVSAVLAQTEEEYTRATLANQRKFDLYAVLLDAKEDGEYSQGLAIVPSQRQTMGSVIESLESEIEQNMEVVHQRMKLILDDESLSADEKAKRSKQLRFQQAKDSIIILDRHFAKIERVLMPWQYKMLQQLAIKGSMERDIRRAGIKATDQYFDLLDLSTEERKELEATLAEVNKGYQEELAALRKEFEQKATKTLPVKSQKELKKLFGDWYYFGQ